MVVIGSGKAQRCFAFDHAFGPESRQEEVYETCVRPLIKDCVKGYNCTVFAYGQTGSGKTFTIGCKQYDDITSRHSSEDALGEERQVENDGVIPRVLNELFVALESARQGRIDKAKRAGDAPPSTSGHDSSAPLSLPSCQSPPSSSESESENGKEVDEQVHVRISFVEVYNGALRDLLRPTAAEAPPPPPPPGGRESSQGKRLRTRRKVSTLTVREGPGGTVVVTGAQEYVFSVGEEMFTKFVS